MNNDDNSNDYDYINENNSMNNNDGNENIVDIK